MSDDPKVVVNLYLDYLVKSRYSEIISYSDNITQYKLGELLTPVVSTEKIIHTSQETFVTIQCKGKGAKKRDVGEGKVPVSFTGYRVHKGQFIYSRIDARNGAFAIIPGELDGAVVSKDFPVFNIHIGIVNPIFLLFSTLQTNFIEQIQNNSFGATNRQRIKEEVLLNKSIKLPDLKVQNQFTDFVMRVDNLRASFEKLLAFYDELIKSKFIEMFGDPKFNNSNLIKIKDIGKLTSGGTPSRSNSEYFKGKIRWYSAGELNSLFLPDSIEHITEDALLHSSAKMFKKDTLLIGMYDTAAFKMGILTEDASSNQACANLEPDYGYNVIWLYYVLDLMKPIFLNERQGVRQKNLSLSKIKEFQIPVASSDMQKQFADFVKKVYQSKLGMMDSIFNFDTVDII